MTDAQILSLLGGSIILLFVLAIFAIVFYIFYIVSLWKLFKKAGKNGWEALIPFYNTWILVEISELNWWYFLIAISGTLLGFIDLGELSWISFITEVASLVANYFIFYNLAKKMHKEPVGIGIGGAIIPNVMVIVLGLSKNFQYDSSLAVSPNGPIDDSSKSSYSATSTPERFCLGCGRKLKPNTIFCENCGKKID